MKNIFEAMYHHAVVLNHKNINELLIGNKNTIFLDLGCDDGILTMKLARKIGTKKVQGIDIVDSHLKQAEINGVKAIKADLNNIFPIKSDGVDVVHANQVIEHISDLDKFMSEIFRIIKPGGYAIISTENASSWCNIVALMMGWQMFSLTNVSSKASGVGNPLALHRSVDSILSSWTHKTIFSLRGLREFFEIWGFKVEEIRGAGYFPLCASLGNLDKNHCHFMTLKIRKPYKHENINN